MNQSDHPINLMESVYRIITLAKMRLSVFCFPLLFFVRASIECF